MPKTRRRKPTPSRATGRRKKDLPAPSVSRDKRRKVLVIGAGPSGLVALKTLRENGYDAVCIESSSEIGGTFASKSYDNGALVSSKYITAFSDFRWETASDNHPPIPEYLSYLNEYCEAFNLYDHIYFDVQVTRLHKHHVGKNAKKNVTVYSVSCKFMGDQQAQADIQLLLKTKFDAVAVCSGLHNVPYTPKITGLDHFKGKIIHSSQYKKRSIFKNKKVLIVGCGETAMDLAYRAVTTSNKQVSLVVRHGFLSVPTVLTEDIPLDTYITNLFECCYQHKWYVILLVLPTIARLTS